MDADGQQRGRSRGRHFAQPVGCLEECASPDCSTVVFGSGLCIECEHEFAQPLVAGSLETTGTGLLLERGVN